jgi:hypothetical protein
MSCKLVSEEKKDEGLVESKKDLFPPDTDKSGINTLDDIAKLISKKKGGSQKGGKVDLASCTTVLAGVLCATATIGGIWAFTVACQKYGVTLHQLQSAKDVLEKSLVGCGTVEGVAARKLAANYSPIPACSDITLKIENVVTEIAELMKKAPGNILSAASNGWIAATVAAGAICKTISAGECYLNKEGGKKSRTSKKSKKSRKQRRKTKKN